MIYQLLLSSRSKYHNNLQRESQQTFQPDAEVSNIQAHWEHYKHVCKEWTESKRSCNNLLIEFSIDEKTGAVMVTRTHHQTFPIQQRIEVNKPVKEYVTLTKAKNVMTQGDWPPLVFSEESLLAEISTQTSVP